MTKQHILQEIKRISLANGGKVPGRITFYQATSIREQDWSGKYWSRWSDAIREAGLAPNSMTAGYDDEFLIEKLINLIRELRCFPTSRELKMKAYVDKKFPSTKTFEKHFGSKRQLIAKVVKYCQERNGFEDVTRICEVVSAKAEDEKPTGADIRSEEKLGIVYLIKSDRFYKIGKTNSIGRREYDLAIQLAEKPTTIHVIKTDDPDGIEAYWHRRFAAKRKNGEWFDLNAVDIKAFKRWVRIV